MIRPVLPPTFLSALPAPWRAPEIAGPADDVTFDRPSDAFDVADAATSFDFAVACAAASDVDEACLTAVRRKRNCDCRRAVRAAGAGIVGDFRQKGNDQGRGIMKGNSQVVMAMLYCPIDELVEVLEVRRSVQQKMKTKSRFLGSGTSGRVT